MPFGLMSATAATGNPTVVVAIHMPFKSQAQRRKFATLLLEGKASDIRGVEPKDGPNPRMATTIARQISLHPTRRGSIVCTESPASDLPRPPPRYADAMSDDQDLPFYSPNCHPPEAPRNLRVEPLWAVRDNHVTWSCELRFHGDSYGWEAQIPRNGELFATDGAFTIRAAAVEWGQERRTDAKRGFLE
jgi:hypothetical protein